MYFNYLKAAVLIWWILLCGKSEVAIETVSTGEVPPACLQAAREGGQRRDFSATWHGPGFPVGV